MSGPADDPHRITHIDALEACYGAVSERSRDKVSERLLAEHREFIERAGFCVIASSGTHSLDCSPRGDAPGKAFLILDDQRIAFPDRRGNNRIDTLRHLIDDSRVAMLFLTRGTEQALRVRGDAHITVDPEMLTLFTLDDEQPRTVIVVQVSGVLLQNTRAIRRSRLWQPPLDSNP